MKKSILLGLMVVGCFALSAFAETNVYVNGIDANYPPFAYVDETGNPTGFDVDAMNWIAQKMGFSVSHQPVDWDAIVPALVNKKIDMICSGLSISPERLAHVTFTDPYWDVHKVFLVRSDSTLTEKDILHGKKLLGVQRGTNEAVLLQQNLDVKKGNYTLRYVESGPSGIEKLQAGQIDALGLDSAPAADALAKGQKVKIAGVFGDSDLFAVATRNEDEALRTLLNEGYKLLMADPYWNELQARYIK